VSGECSQLGAPPAYTPGELERVLSGRAARGFASLAFRISKARADIDWAWRLARAPRLTLPRERDRVLIGRAPGCECRLGEETVSRRHALLLRRQGGWTIEDLGSLNGTLLNGWRVVIPTEVRPGDIVTFGEVALRVAE
jgi:hypothetical protein